MTDAAVLAQLDAVLADFKALAGKRPHDDWSGLPEEEVSSFISRARSAIHRIAGPESTFAIESQRKPTGAHWEHESLPHLAGVVQALRTDVQAGFLIRLKTLYHADIFSDFIEMAGHLLEHGYKDAAAVLVGGALESHLKQLCAKHGISLTIPSPSGDKPKKADLLNADLSNALVYGRLELKNVIAWLDLRNKAAHSEYTKYNKDQVELMLAGVRQFISQYAA